MLSSLLRLGRLPGKCAVARGRKSLRLRPNLKVLSTRAFSQEEDTSNDDQLRNLIVSLSKSSNEPFQDVNYHHFFDPSVGSLLDKRECLVENLKNLREILNSNDAEMRKLAIAEHKAYRESLSDINKELLSSLIDNLGQVACDSVILELSAGAGGKEAATFCRELLDMYLRHLDYLGFEHHMMDLAKTDISGVRHACVVVSGKRALECLRHEAGVHRVQRVPATERLGRMHTSTVSVAVFAQPSEIEVTLNPKDVKIETKRASGPGGQSVNTTDSAVRVTHIPTGISVDSQTERCQITNRKIAMIRLRAKIYQQRLEKQIHDTNQVRRQQMGLRNRNEKIRTYNFQQNRLVDHRIADGTFHDLPDFLQGGPKLAELHDKLQRDLRRRIYLDILREEGIKSS